MAGLLAGAAASAVQETAASRFALAIVADSRNRPILDVTADDFAVQEGPDTREILSVRPADYPVALVIDGGSSGAEATADFSDIRTAAGHLIERLGVDRAVALSASDPPRIIAALTDDRRTVMDRLSALEPSASVSSQVLGAIALTARTLHGTGTLFASVVVIAQSSNASDRSELETVLGPIVDSGAVVHVVERAGGAGRSGGRGGEDSALRQIATQTRGEYARIYSAASYQAALDHLADRLVSELLIEYLVPVGSKPVDVKIGVKLPGAHVRGLGVAPR